MATRHTILRVLLGCCLVATFLLLQATASAESLTIQYTGLDISYNGSAITEVGNPDSLSALSFKIGGVEVPPVLTSGITIDLNIPGVSGLSVTGGNTTSSAGGTLGLTLPGGDFLNLQLGAADVIFVPITGTFKLYFVLGASAANVLSQSLPIDSTFEESVAVSFSTQVVSGSLKSSAGVVTGFVASGTGEIEGSQVPEPTAAALLISGLLACAAGIRRRG